MKRDDELRAWLRWLVRANHSSIIEQVEAAVRDLHAGWPHVSDQALLTSSRIGNLRHSVDWHYKRPTAPARLSLLREELKRLYDQAAGTLAGRAHQVFYARLNRLIWIEPDSEWLEIERSLGIESREKPIWSEIERELDLSDKEQQQWEPEVRLALALAVLDALTALYETQPLQAWLDNELGGWQWLS